MKKISRTEAETLFKTSEVVSTNIEQNKKEMCIFMEMANDFAFLIKYNLCDHQKTYYLQESGV